jgi:hypothetical protein
MTTVAFIGVILMEVSVTWTPTPLKATVCVPEPALSRIVNEPVRVPAAAGVKVTAMLHGALTPKAAPQLFASEKSPDALMPLMFSVAFPVFVSVTLMAELLVPTAWFPKLTLTVDRLAIGAAEEVPVPVKVTSCGLFEALSVIVRVPCLVPNADGVKVIEIVQLADGASGELEMQLSVSA